MTARDGPSAQMFAYLTGIGVPPDGLTPEHIESLRWEVDHAPRVGASTDERIAFLVAVVSRTRSARSRESAADELRRIGGAARAAVPTLLAAVRGPPLVPSDGSRGRVIQALAAIGWDRAFDAELPRWLRMIPSTTNELRNGLVELISAQGPASRPVVTLLIRLLGRERGRVLVFGRDPVRVLGARALGQLLSRDVAVDARLRRRAVRALERAVRFPDDYDHLREVASKALENIAARDAR